MEFYFFSAYEDYEKAIDEDLFYLAFKDDDSIDLELSSTLEHDNIEFSMIFNRNYDVLKLNSKKFKECERCLDDKEKLKELILSY